LEGSFTQSQHLTWRWGYQYAKSVSPSGEIELRRPRHSGQVRMNLNFDRWNLSMAVKRTGEQRDLYYPPSPPYQLEVALPGFTVASLAGSFRLHPDWEIFLRTDNLLDHAFEEVFGYKAPGRKVSAGIRWVR
jgi:outer membrane cobalamin receptor